MVKSANKFEIRYFDALSTSPSAFYIIYRNVFHSSFFIRNFHEECLMGLHSFLDFLRVNFLIIFILNIHILQYTLILYLFINNHRDIHY